MGKGDTIKRIDLATEIKAALNDKPTEIEIFAAKQIEEYFCGKRKSFDFPISPEGTPFQMRVWDVLKKLPYGKIITYGEIAEIIGKPGASRAVGMACNRNRILIAIPCHRVVGRCGALIGFAHGIDMKRALLDIEGVCL